jgi:LysR family glycine cleavage system transcriptional activator
VKTSARLRFNDSMHAMQAAIFAQGVAIVSLVPAADAIAFSLLVRPFRQSLRGETYHFASAPELHGRAAISMLRDWFRRNLAGS